MSKPSIKGEYKRKQALFRDIVTSDGSSGYKAEPNRYHLYHSSACPWCHRVVLMIALKGLKHVISCSNVEPLITTFPITTVGNAKYIGWEFSDKYPDPLHTNSKSVLDIYKMHDPDYDGKQLTVPIFFDKKTQKIVNNESSEIIAFLNSEFNAFATNSSLDLNPTNDMNISKRMKQWDQEIYPNLNNGVYRCGFGKSQQAYDTVIETLFGTLDKMEKCLDQNRYLCGNRLTLTDIRAWVTLIRFDVVYFTHFKCNAKMISHDYPNIWEYTKEIYQMNGVKETFDMDYTKKHYYGSHKSVNPHGIVPYGPLVNFDEPHSRDLKFISVDSAMKESLKLRSLQRGDYDKGFVELLRQLTDVGNVSKSSFEYAFDHNISKNKTILVIEDLTKQKIIASASLLKEYKFTNECGTHGHIEDVVVDKGYRGLGLGKVLTDKLVEISQAAGDHRVILDCQEHNVKFYEKCGFHIRGVEMAMYHKPNSKL